MTTFKSDIDRLVAQNKKEQVQNEELLAKSSSLMKKSKPLRAIWRALRSSFRELKSFRFSPNKPFERTRYGNQKAGNEPGATEEQHEAHLAALNQRIWSS